MTSNPQDENVVLIDTKDIDSMVLVKETEELSDETNEEDNEDANSEQNLNDDNPEHKDSPNSDQGDILPEDKDAETKNEDLSEKLEGLATKDELAEIKSKLEAKEKELEEAVGSLKQLRVKEMAEKVVAREIELGSTKEEDKASRVEALIKAGEDTMEFIMSSYSSIPEPKVEEKDTDKTGEPKAKNLSANEGTKPTEDEIETKAAELRESFFGHKEARVDLREMGIDEESGTMRYIEKEKV